MAGRSRGPLASGLIAALAWFGACQSSFDECHTRSQCLGKDGGTSSLTGIGNSSSGAGEAAASGGGAAGEAGAPTSSGNQPDADLAGGSGEGGGDAQAPGGKSPLAGGKCDWQAPFGTPQRVPAPFNSTTGGQQYSTNDSFWLSDDGLRAYFSARSGTSLNSYDIFWSQRDSTLSAFPSPLPLALSSPTRERQISLNASELLLAYQNDDEILLSARKSQNEDFAPGVALPSPVNIPILHVRSGEAFLTRDGRQLYFTSNRAGTNDLHVVQLDGVTPVGDAEPLVELNTTMYEGAPLLSDDELTIYYQSGVMAQVWSAHRRDLSSSFEDPHPVLELGSDAEEWPEALSADGCHIYTCRWHRDLDYTLYESFRSPTWTKP